MTAILEYLLAEDEETKATGRQLIDEMVKDVDFIEFDKYHSDFKSELAIRPLKPEVVDCFFFANFQLEQKRFNIKKSA